MLATIVKISPSVEAVDRAAYQLSSALDAVVSALSDLQPDISRWPPPVSTLNGAMRDSRDYRRVFSRLKEVLHRIECVAGEEIEEDLTEVMSAAQDMASEAAACGWRLGLATTRSAPLMAVSE